MPPGPPGGPRARSWPSGVLPRALRRADQSAEAFGGPKTTAPAPNGLLWPPDHQAIPRERSSLPERSRGPKRCAAASGVPSGAPRGPPYAPRGPRRSRAAGQAATGARRSRRGHRRTVRGRAPPKRRPAAPAAPSWAHNGPAGTARRPQAAQRVRPAGRVCPEASAGSRAYVRRPSASETTSGAPAVPIGAGKARQLPPGPSERTRAAGGVAPKARRRSRPPGGLFGALWETERRAKEAAWAKSG